MVGANNDTTYMGNLEQLGGKFQDPPNEYKIEMQPITGNEINQMGELVIANACRGGIDLQDTIERIGMSIVV